MLRKFIIQIGFTLLIIFSVAITVFWHNDTLISLGVITFILGLRHGFDVDHIVAIDNVTRKLAYENKPSMTTGFFFAIGHSTIVFILTLLIIIGAIVFKGTIGKIGDYSGAVGPLVSAGFLWLTAIANLPVLINLLNNKQHHHVAPKGMIAFLGKWLFNIVDRPIKMFVVGLFFGLGFDTATEVALLGMAGSATLHGISQWDILVLPLIFASGMIITDSINSICMSKIYCWVTTDPNRLRNYNLTLISFSIVFAILVGSMELINLILSKFHFSTSLTIIGDVIDNHSETCGLLIAGVFVFVWLYYWIRQQKPSKLNIN